MDGKFLGKIAKSEFGTYSDRPFLMGLQIEFRFDGGGVSDGGRHLINIGDNCRWENVEEKNSAYQNVLKDLAKILEDAKVNYVSQLVGKPIEIVIKNQQYESFRILTEVL